MVFASIEFLTLFLPGFLLLYFLAPAGARNAVLLVASWLFYGWWEPIYLLLLWSITALGYGFGLAIAQVEGEHHKRHLLLLGLVLNLGCLAWFKYANLMVSTANWFLLGIHHQSIPWVDIALPIGLSFYVLHSVSYLMDIRRGTIQPERNFVRYGIYITMFTQLVAGPIIRYRSINQELVHRNTNWDGFAQGARRFMLGFAGKVLIADALAPLVDVAFGLKSPTLADAWLGSLAYGLQLLFDFSGYSAMAIGLAQMLGFSFPENFNRPYLATSVQEFWRRWHVSLSNWLRDYLYIPLGGSRGGTVRTYVNLFLTMLIGGLWHGASWTFVAWGALHGVALAVERVLGPSLMHRSKVLSYVWTMAVVFVGWTLFRSGDWTTAQAMLAGQFGLNGLGSSDAVSSALRPAILFWLCVGLSVIAWPVIPKPKPMLAMGLRRAMAGIGPALAFVYACSVLVSNRTVPFLYFQF